MKQTVFISAIVILAHCTAQKKMPRAVPVIKDGIYSIKLQNQELEADPQTGGRIISLKIDGRNFFTGKDINPLYWGSTFWASPQKIWGGPKLLALDKEAYAASIENQIIKMVSQKDSRFGFVFTKEISGNNQDSSFTITYAILNQSDTARKVAPWEVTRVYPDGLAFYPRGDGERWGNMANQAEDINGITWFNYRKDKIMDQQNKFFADGSEGWIAQVNDDIIFVKSFPDIPLEKAAPSEAEVEIYTNPQKSYVEIEQQGAYVELPPGASLRWQVTWYLRKLPADIKREKGNPGLVSYARKLVNAHKKFK
ncbi:MAG: DUF4380 domain-containing protein [Chitinophagaceae bacterium]